MFHKVMIMVIVVLGLFTSLAAIAGNAGAVYAMTNAADGNAVVIYNRANDGQLTLAGQMATGGLGSGGDPPLEPVDALGAQNPLIFSRNGRFLLAVNAGSDEISVFRVNKDRLVLVDKVHSGGDFPVSLTLHRDLLYVLNSGGDGNITGFKLKKDGRLTPIAGSTRSLNVGGASPPFFLVSPAQVGFNPSGDFLVVTIKGTNEIRVFSIDEEGVPNAQPEIATSNGTTPFSFVFSRRGDLIVVEAFGTGAVGEANAGAASSYDIAPDGSLDVISGSLGNFQTATCWIVASPSGGFAYATNNASNTISGYHIARDGRLSLLDSNGVTALTGVAPVDIAITPNGRFLYNVNAFSGTVSAFQINKADGSLTALGEIGGLPVDDGAVGIAAR